MKEVLLNKRVVHEGVYGYGTIIECIDRSANNLDCLITVLFDSPKKKTKFTYPGSFNGVLRFVNQDDRKEVEEAQRIVTEQKKELERIKEEKKRTEKERAEKLADERRKAEQADQRKKEKIKIKEIIKDRKIHALLHVTQLNNLESILVNGIIPVDELNDVEASINDTERMEGCRDCSSFSIGRMNKYYFGKKNRDNDYSLSFICLHIDPYILADDNEKYFCPSNAASYNVSSRIRSGGLRTSNDFQHMFDESIVAPTINRDGYWRREPAWPDSWPTDWQAEVLYQGIVHPQHILKVEFKSDEDLENSREILKKHGISGSVNYNLNFW